MSLKLFALVMLAELAFAKAQSPVVPAGPSSGDLVAQHAAKVEYVLQQFVAKSNAPVEVKTAVQLAAEEQLALCVAAAEGNPNPGQFFACTGLVLKQASDALSAASSGASASWV